jgi:glyoxylase-like metal-dependent hydrolase (beta-lactamase superfamily II)
MAKPISVRVRMYNVGFGDCFLVTFDYGGNDRRHLLIDYGSNRRPPGGMTLAEIGKSVATETGGKLMGVVLSHRHKDHIAGFDPANGGETVRGLAPDLVLRPWTE